MNEQKLNKLKKKYLENFEDKIIDNNKVEVNQEMYRRMAEDICACTKNLIAVLDKIENTPKIEKDLKIPELKKELEVESLKSEKCIQHLQKDNNSMIEIDQDLSDAALLQYCPEFYNMLKIGRVR